MLRTHALGVVSAFVCTSAFLTAGTIGFEDLPEETVVSNQYAVTGVIFNGSPQVLTAGSFLNEIDFPPHSGVNVIADLGGPIALTFTPNTVSSFSAWFTYTTQLTLQTFTSGGTILQTLMSADTSNLGSNELIGFNSPLGNIGSVLITGDSGGGSFTMDDVTLSSVPEPSPGPMIGFALVLCGLVCLGRTKSKFVLQRGRAAGKFLMVAASVAGGAVCLHAQGLRLIDSLTPQPILVYINNTTVVTFVATVEANSTLLPDGVTLNQVTPTGQLIQTVGRMYDDGSHGDVVANDYKFALQVPILQNVTGAVYYSATAAYRGTIVRVQLSGGPIAIQISNPATSTAPDVTKLMTDSVSNTTFPLNQALFIVPVGTPLGTVNAIAALCPGGTIVGFTPLSNQYQVQFANPTNNQAILTACINAISAAAAVTSAGKNLLGKPQAIQNDLTNLAVVAPTKANAYQIIQATGAYQFLADINAPLNPVKVGIVDTGVDGTHAEFASGAVNFASGSVLTDTDGHGTAMTGIIGASNSTPLTGYKTTPDAEMNGILAGVSTSSSLSGSRVPYTLDVRAPSANEILISGASWAEVSAAIADLVSKNANVIYVGYSWPTFTPEMTSGLGSQLTASLTTTTFVFPAGNGAADVSTSFPGMLAATHTNAIAVAGTLVDGTDAVWCPVPGSICSNTGTGITLAAPAIVYAPTLGAGHALAQGTSGAAALVAGAAGLLSSANPLSPTQIRNYLILNGDPVAANLGGKRLNLKRAVKFAAQPVDIFFLVDTTGSTSVTLTPFKNVAAQVVNSLVNAGINPNFGLGEFRDYPISPFGVAGLDFAYLLRYQNTPLADRNGNGVPDVLDSLNALTSGSGSDTPEAQLPALFKMADSTGAAQIIPGFPSAGIPSNQQAVWRPNSLRFALIFTDAGFHRPGDAGTIPYPGPDFATTLAALNAQEIRVIGIEALSGGGSSYDASATADLQAVATGTNAIVPAGTTVDCRGDGTQILTSGQPLVCKLGPNGSGIAQAIINTLLAVANQ